jgi:26S proteasome regulatory subunit N5
MPKASEAEKDYSKLLETEVPLLSEEAKKGNLSGALEGLFLLEKQTRQGSDFVTCSKIAREIVRVCYQAQNWEQLNETLVTLSKRRGQSKTVIQESVQEAMSFLDHIEDVAIATELVKILRSITEGKIFVELESAELTKRLASIYEKSNEVKKAAKVLQEVQVETLSKMETKDKVIYILEQVRLCLACNDYIRALILSRKVNQKLLLQDSFQEEKLRYHHLMIQLFHNQKNHLDIARAYQAAYNTPTVLENEEQWSRYLKLLCLYTVLSPFSSDQSDIINRTFGLKNLGELPLYKQLLKQFLTKELMNWPSILESYKAELSSFPDFVGPEGTALWETLQLRVVEHVRSLPLRVVSALTPLIEPSCRCWLLPTH